MTSPQPVVFVTLLFLARMAQANEPNSQSPQVEIFVSANVGDGITLQCFLTDKLENMHWYKQSLGQKPQLISTLKVGGREATFYDEFQNRSRFALDSGNNKNHLKIIDLSSSDSAFYYCIASTAYVVEPLRLVFVSVKDSFSSHPLPSIDQSGNFPTPNCTVDIVSCGEEHSVYWFRDSGGAQPGLIYTQGGSSDQCRRNNTTLSHTCVYTLPAEHVKFSRTGTYYCAVAACGHILFGNRNNLDGEPDKDLFLVYLLSGALTCTSMLVLFQSVLLFRNRRPSKDSQGGLARSPQETSQANQDTDHIHYAALSVNLPHRTRRQRNSINHACVYASVKQNGFQGE